MLKNFWALSIAFLLLSLTFNQIKQLNVRYENLRYRGAELAYGDKFASLKERLDQLQFLFAANATRAEREYAQIKNQISLFEKGLNDSEENYIAFMLEKGVTQGISADGLFFENTELNTKTPVVFTSASGHRIELDSGTTIRIDRARFNKRNSTEKIIIEFRSGRIKGDIKNSSRDDFIVHWRKKRLKCVDSSFEFLSRGDTGILKVVSGGVWLGSRKIGAGYGAVFHNNQVIIDRLPRYPKFQKMRKYYTISPKIGLRLKWDKIKDATSYIVQIRQASPDQKIVYYDEVKGLGIEVPSNWFINKEKYNAFISSRKENGIESVTFMHPTFEVIIDSTPPRLILDDVW